MKAHKKSRLYDVSQIRWNDMMFSKQSLRQLLFPLMLQQLLSSFMVKASNAYGDVAKNVKMPPEIERQIARTPLRSILKQVAKSITPADVQQLNAALNKIKKES